MTVHVESEVSVLSRGAVTETAVVVANGRELVVKRLLPHAIELAEAKSGLTREARILGRLAGHGAPALVATDLAAQTPAIYMERWPGTPLSALGSLDRAEIDAVVACALEALAAIQDAGVVHGDISAENLLVGADHASCTLVDFQLASDAEGSPLHDGAFRGTLAYVAPEVARGQSPTKRSDLFSLALALVELGLPRNADGTRRTLRPAEGMPAVRLVAAAETPIELAPEVRAACANWRHGTGLLASLAHDEETRPKSARAVLSQP